MPGKFVDSTAYSSYPTLSADQQQLLLNALQSNDQRIPYDQLRASSHNSSTGEERIFKTISNGQSVNRSINPSALNNNSSPTTPNGFVSFRAPTFGDGFLPGISNGQETDYDVDLPQDVTDSLSGFAHGEHAEKRKSFDSPDEDGGDYKRGEDDENRPKKPGRKPVTAEPTTKRKAQNRAAQRAFRERKEQHLSSLENKISDLQAASSAANSENSLLKAQVFRLQNELRDYRKRLSSGTGIGGTSPKQNTFSQYQNTQGSNPFDFSFGTDASFDSFASLPVQNNALRSAVRSSSDPYATGFKRESSSGSNGSANGNNNNNNSSNSSYASSNGSRQQHTMSMPNVNHQNGNLPKDTNDVFTPGFFNLNNNTYGFPQFGSPTPAFKDISQGSRQGSNSVSEGAPSLTSHGDSPSVSSNALSSCGASPEPNHETADAGKAANHTPFGDLSAFQFNPDTALFGDYREPQTNILGDGDFTGGLYDDWLNVPDVADFNFADPQAYQPTTPGPKKFNLMDEVEKQRDAIDVDVIPILGKEHGKEREMMTCNKIWQQLRNCPKFQEGDLDIDGLCGELQKKATCSESGASISKDEWHNALWRIAGISETEQAALVEKKKNGSN